MISLRETLVINPFESGFIPWLKTSGVLTLPLFLDSFSGIDNHLIEVSSSYSEITEEHS